MFLLKINMYEQKPTFCKKAKQRILEEFQKKCADSGFSFRHEFLKHSNDILNVANIVISYRQKQITTEFFNFDQIKLF